MAANAPSTGHWFGDEECLFFCCMGLGGLSLPNVMVSAWEVGFKRLMSTADIGNWPRYTFLVVQSLLLLAGIIVSFAAPFDDDVAKYLRVSALSVAMAINFLERFLFWCVHALTGRRDNGTWTFRADVIRLFLTEVFIYIGLMTAIYTTSNHGTYYSYYDDNYYSRGYSIAALVGLTYFLTAVVMKIFVAVKVTRSLLKARRRNNSNAATSQKRLLYGLCIFTCAVCALQILLVIFVILSLQTYETGGTAFFVMIFGSFVPVSLWCLYFLHVMPWARFLPLSMALDLPPTANCPEEIDVRGISPQFHRIHNKAMSCGGLMMSFLRLLTSPLFVISHFLYLGACGSLVLSLVYSISYYYYPLTAFVGSIAIILLFCLSLPAIIWGLTIVCLIPICPCFYTVLCFMFSSFNPRSYSATSNTVM